MYVCLRRLLDDLGYIKPLVAEFFDKKSSLLLPCSACTTREAIFFNSQFYHFVRSLRETGAGENCCQIEYSVKFKTLLSFLKLT